jgi:uncharacterized protein YuzE
MTGIANSRQSERHYNYTCMTVPVRITCDRSANAAYIHLTDIDACGVAKTVHFEDPDVRGMINLDFDASGRLIGIEVVGATHALPSGILDDADRI